MPPPVVSISDDKAVPYQAGALPQRTAIATAIEHP
jgi:hypothetical protein